MFQDGGQVFNTHGSTFKPGNLIFINSGGTHEENPREGVQLGKDPQNVPNLVEEGEVIFNDYVFSNRLHPSEKELVEANLPKRYKGHTFALIAEDMGKESSERPNDPISRRGLEDSMMKLAMVQEAQRARKGKKGTQHLMSYGGRKYDGDSNLFKVPETVDETIVERLPNGYLMSTEPFNSHQEAANRAIVKSYDDSPFNTDYSLSTGLRYAPVLGSAVGVLKSAFTKPDYEHSNSLIEVSKTLSNPRVRYNPVNRYLLYRPLDRNWYLNNVRAQSGATRRAILDASAGNSGAAIAGLLAADRASQEAQGDAMMKMAMYNENLRQATEQFNRQTDQMNSQGLMAADQANAGIMQNRDRLRTGLLTQALQMREASDAALEATRSANLTNFFDNLGGVGRENMGWNWTKYLADSGAFGNLREGYPAPGMGKNGGLLTKRNRRRR